MQGRLQYHYKVMFHAYQFDFCKNIFQTGKNSISKQMNYLCIKGLHFLLNDNDKKHFRIIRLLNTENNNH